MHPEPVARQEAGQSAVDMLRPRWRRRLAAADAVAEVSAPPVIAASQHGIYRPIVAWDWGRRAQVRDDAATAADPAAGDQSAGGGR